MRLDFMDFEAGKIAFKNLLDPKEAERFTLVRSQAKRLVLIIITTPSHGFYSILAEA
jgi:hypothetical protein